MKECLLILINQRAGRATYQQVIMSSFFTWTLDGSCFAGGRGVQQEKTPPCFARSAFKKCLFFDNMLTTHATFAKQTNSVKTIVSNRLKERNKEYILSVTTR